MNLRCLSIHDLGLTLAGGESSPRLLPVDGDTLRSPGVAWGQGPAQCFGLAAAAHSWAAPAQLQQHFWDRLSPAEGDPSAVLAMKQLEQLLEVSGSRQAELLLIFPDHYGREALGLLLGMGQQLGLRVRALLPGSLAAVAGAEHVLNGSAVHVDLSLHRLTLSLLKCEAGQVQRVRSLSEPGLGFSGLRQRWMNRVAEAFVRTTRYDPLHHPDNARELAQRLPQLLQALHSEEEIRLTLPLDGEDRSVVLLRSDWVEAAAAFLRGAAELLDELCEEAGVSPQHIFFSDSAGRVPGLPQRLQADPARLSFLPEGAPALGALAACQNAGNSFPAASGPSAPLLTSLRTD